MQPEYKTGKRDKEFLKNWLCSQGRGHINAIPSKLCKRVTVLAYFFRNKEDEESAFEFIRGSILQTWQRLGLLKTVIVCNEGLSKPVEFANQYPDWISIQVESSLIPGKIDCLSIDCNSKLHTRFETDYVLTIQDDAFPLKAGLGDFIGKFDFIGAPWRRCNLQGWLAGKVSHIWPMNGGFSLRSHRFCECVAEYWDRYYSKIPFDRSIMAEDTFCTSTLPQKHRLFAHNMKWPTAFEAAQFSYDASIPENKRITPLGFHGTKAFYELMHLKSIVRETHFRP